VGNYNITVVTAHLLHRGSNKSISIYWSAFMRSSKRDEWPLRRQLSGL